MKIATFFFKIFKYFYKTNRKKEISFISFISIYNVCQDICAVQRHLYLLNFMTYLFCLFLLWCLFMLVMTWWQPCCSLVYLLLLFVSTIVIPFAASCLTNCFFIELNFDRCRFSLLSHRGFSLNVVSVVVAAVPNSGTLTVSRNVYFLLLLLSTIFCCSIV